MTFNTLKYFDHIATDQSAAFYYRGPFLEKFTSTFLNISQGSESSLAQVSSIGKKMSFVIVECFQNILRHAENKEKIGHLIEDVGMFSFKNIDGTFVINSINVINNPEVEKVKILFEKVNSLNKEDLKQYYLENLQKNSIGERGGAGLGLIEMARKSGQKILYQIEELDNNYSHFHQQITLRKNGLITLDDKQLEYSGKLYKKMIQDDIVLIYKGEFTQCSILPLLELAEHNVKVKTMDQRKTLRAAHVTIEMLQNISKHGKKSTGSEVHYGLFLLSKSNGNFALTCANSVNIKEKALLEEKLEYLTSLDDFELNELHRSTLRATLRFENKLNSGLGLIEIAKASKNSLNYEFIPYSRDQFLFAFQVSL